MQQDKRVKLFTKHLKNEENKIPLPNTKYQDTKKFVLFDILTVFPLYSVPVQNAKEEEKKKKKKQKKKKKRKIQNMFKHAFKNLYVEK